MTKFLVIVYRPRDPAINQGSFVDRSPQVKRLTASSIEMAVNNACVPPGGYCEVVEVEQVRRFDRAAQAPLVERFPITMGDGTRVA